MWNWNKNGSLSKTLHIHCCQNLNCSWAGIIHHGLSLAFQRWYKKKILFELSFTRSNVLYSPTFISHFHNHQSVSIQMVLRICISLLQVLSYRQLQMKSEVYIHLSQIHLNSVFHNSWHLILVNIRCFRSVRIMWNVISFIKFPVVQKFTYTQLVFGSIAF